MCWKNSGNHYQAAEDNGNDLLTKNNIHPLNLLEIDFIAFFYETNQQHLMFVGFGMCVLFLYNNGTILYERFALDDLMLVISSVASR